MMPISPSPLRRHAQPRQTNQGLSGHRARRSTSARAIPDLQAQNAGAERADANQATTTPIRTSLPLPPLQTRRAALLAFFAAAAAVAADPPSALAFLSSSRAVSAVSIVPGLRPDPLSYDAGDPRLREAANALQLALNAESLAEEERLWTAVISRFEPFLKNSAAPAAAATDASEPYSDSAPAPWAPEIVSRACEKNK